MATKTTNTVLHRSKSRRKRPGIHSKSRASGLKTSKNYLKKYAGQG